MLLAWVITKSMAAIGNVAVWPSCIMLLVLFHMIVPVLGPPLAEGAIVSPAVAVFPYCCIAYAQTVGHAKGRAAAVEVRVCHSLGRAGAFVTRTPVLSWR